MNDIETSVSESRLLPARHHELVSRALRALGIEQFVLAIHDASFPGAIGDDAGHGSPVSRGGDRFFDFARALGFQTLQLGPAGQTSDGNASPYDATAFSRNFLSIALRELTEEGPFAALLPPHTLAEIAEGIPGRPDRVHHRYAFRAHDRALHEAFSRFQRGNHVNLATRISEFARENATWLESGEEQAFRQYIAHTQHQNLRGRLARRGMTLHGDLHIGLSVTDRAIHAGVHLAHYVMGAPPSRTNPDGQPWGYPVLDPAQFVEPGSSRPGPSLRLLIARIDKMFAEYDGLRIDHPHGLVCPWVYDAADPDPQSAVRHGARLYSSPNLADHPGLARYAVVSPNQIRQDTPRYADGWVTDLSAEQVDRYGMLFEAIVASAARHGRERSHLVCEVLSTMPLPLQRVLERYDMGRFRVVQKANLDDPTDVYRTENARPEDWVMLGTHDTPPAFRVAQRFVGSNLGARWAAHLANRLSTSPVDAQTLGRELQEGGANALVHALFADMCASQARHVMVFWADVFGLLDVYNTPGTVNDENWSLRIPPDFERFYLTKLGHGEALNLPYALALALRSQTNLGRDELIRSLLDLAAELRAIGQALSATS